MAERAGMGGTVLALVLALLFVLFAVWCGLRAADAWVSGSRGVAALYALGALGGLSLGVRNFRRALMPAPDGGPPS